VIDTRRGDVSKKLFSLPAITMVLNTLLVSCGRTQHPTPADDTQDTDVRPADGMTMVYVPGGEFKMGQTWSLQGWGHTVELDAFWIDQTQVGDECPLPPLSGGRGVPGADDPQLGRSDL
jgi:formylglycine-generating enzyme required for sulfatase activity